jgi:uncharacterized protein (UPF0147 family)
MGQNQNLQTTIRELKQSLDRIMQVKDNPGQLQQAVQEAQQKLQQLEQQAQQG